MTTTLNEQIETERRDLIAAVWNYFIEHDGTWPTRRWWLLLKRDKRITFDPERGYGHGVGVSEYPSPHGQVKLTADALLALPAALELLTPLPELVLLAAQRFIDAPHFRLDLEPRPKVTRADIERLWTPERTPLVVSLLDGLRIPALGGRSGSPDDPYFEVDYDVVRYRDVQTVHDALAARGHSRTATDNPSGPHLELLQRVFAHAKKHGEWPIALPFALQNLDIGFVPDLVADLHREFVRSEFDASRRGKIELAPRVLALCDLDHSVRDRIAMILREFAHAWRTHDDGRLTERELLERTGLSHIEVAPALLFLADWTLIHDLFKGHSIGGKPGQWDVTLSEKALENEDIESFEDYERRTAAQQEAERQRYWSLDALQAVPDDDEAGQHTGAPHDNDIAEVLMTVDSAHVFKAWQKALQRRADDLDGALTAARTLLETVLKHVIEDMGVGRVENADLPELYATAAKALSIDAAGRSSRLLKQVLGSCAQVVQGVGSLRNQMGDAHGRGRGDVSVDPQLAELAVNVAGAMAVFLVREFEAKKKTAPNAGSSLA